MVHYIESPTGRIVGIHFGEEDGGGPPVGSPKFFGEHFGSGDKIVETFITRLDAPFVVPVRGTTWQITLHDNAIFSTNTSVPGNPGGKLEVETRILVNGVAVFTSGHQVFEFKTFSDAFPFNVAYIGPTMPMSSTGTIDVETSFRVDKFAGGLGVAGSTFWEGNFGVRVDPPFF